MQLSFIRTWFHRSLLLSALLLLAGRPARATHIVGGEMELIHQTDEQYELRLNLYFDAVNGNAGALDNDLTASIFDKGNDSRMQNVVLPLVSNTFVNYTNSACAIGTLSTRRLVYAAPVRLPAGTYTSTAGYYAAVERCCRNNTIRNIVSPSTAAQAFYLEFPAVVRNGQPFYDSTPRIFPPLADYACVGELFYYDFGGQDADGDSLVYDLVTPLNGHATDLAPKPAVATSAPYDPISWQPGLGTVNQIPGNPTLSINRRTGRLTVRPTQVGLFVFGVRCAEYRRGRKIGESRRDFQMLSRVCSRNATPSLVMTPGPAGTRPYRAGRDTLRLVPGGNNCIRIRYTDPDPSSRLTVSLNPVNFTQNLPTFTTSTSGTVRLPGQPDTLTATVCFPDCLDSRGRVLLLDLVVADDGCSLPRRDTVRVAFTAVPRPNANPILASTAALPLRARVGDLVSFDLNGFDPDNDPLTLSMSGTGFSPEALGATLTSVAGPGGVRGRFSWRITCAALDPALRTFTFTAAATPCNIRQSASVSVPILVEYANRAPVLTSTLPLSSDSAAIPLVRLPENQPFRATLAGTDADNDQLTLSATGRGFDLAAAGMRFAAQNGAGRANATFEWAADCSGVNLRRDLIVDFDLVDATCRAAPKRRTVRFEVEPPATPELKLYNIITPNGDKLNETFRLPELPPNFCDSFFEEVKIFSRWGQEVFRSADRDFQWPGLGSAGTYYYLVRYNDGRQFKGWVEVKP